MAIIAIIESSEGTIKKTSLEAVSYASELGEDVIGLALGAQHDQNNLSGLASQGAKRVIHDNGENYSQGDASFYSKTIVDVMEEVGADTVIFSTSPFAATIAGRVAVKSGSALVTNVVDLPQTSNGFALKRNIFSGKAYENVEVINSKKIVVIKKNAVPIKDLGGSVNIEAKNYNSDATSVSVTGSEKAEGTVLLPEAEIVVSGGRGLKGPENWTMVEELAGLLGAATACSKPVSDMEWRPHHEHVGQTGLKISPQLYIAIGISGAIQHLAGVNSSKYIVVINKDPDAPFFKEADYGIVGDAFQVVPDLINAIKLAG